MTPEAASLKPLTEYAKNGHQWRVIMRVGDVAMSMEDRHGHFEVFHIQSHQGRMIAGNQVPPAEYPPSNEQWGSKGWSYTNRPDADARFCAEVERAAAILRG